jgi:hypothetical protein
MFGSPGLFPTIGHTKGSLKRAIQKRRGDACRPALTRGNNHFLAVINDFRV